MLYQCSSEAKSCLILSISFAVPRSFKSFANSNVVLLSPAGRSLIKRASYSSWPKTDLCGTPDSTSHGLERLPLTTVLIDCPDKKSLIMFNSGPVTP